MPEAKEKLPSTKALINFTHELADKAASVTLPHFRKPVQIDNKATQGQFDPVTVADRKAEKVIVDMITRKFPAHGIIGEEFGSKNKGAPTCWIIDPVDGTRAFIMGQPLWGTLIGVLHQGVPVAGMMSQPFTGERFWGSSAGAFWRQGTGQSRRIKTRAGVDLSGAILATTCPDLFDSKEQKAFARVKNQVRLTRYGGDCYNYCLLASGFVDIVIEAGLKTYDIAPLIPIIENAGGIVTTWDGEPATEGGAIVACGDSKVHARVLQLLRK